MNNWLTTDEAIQHLGIGRTKLLELLKSGRIPGHKINQQWRISTEELDKWISQSKDFSEFFLSLSPSIDDNFFLRDPQREAYQSIYDFFRKGGKTAIVQLPVGCGKSGVAALAPLGIARGRVLVITPNLTIRKNMKDTLDITNRRKCFWLTSKVLEESDVLAGPYVCSLDKANFEVCKQSHIVVSNIQQLSTDTEKWLDKFSDDFFDMIIVDEAHHGAAKSWQLIFEKFPNAKILNLTATPFRSDRKELGGDLIYRYSFKSATIKGYIKRLTASYVAPDQIDVTFTDNSGTKSYSLEQVINMKDEDWFSKGIALAEECNKSIVENSLEKLENLRLTGTKHQLIAVACSIDHAKQIKALYEERGYSTGVIHSKMEEEEKESVLANLRNNTLDCIVQVQILGEGFDHPKLSVAAIFRPYRSLAPYIQFIGRILRVVIQGDTNHHDNTGHIVTHIGMNIDKLADEFIQFENDDKEFWEKVFDGEDGEDIDLPENIKDGSGKKRLLGARFKVENEIVQTLFEKDFLDDADEAILQHMQKQFESVGWDPNLAKQIMDQQFKGEENKKMAIVEASKGFPILPEREYEMARSRLRDTEKEAARVLLNKLNLRIEGRELPMLGFPAANNNFVSALTMVSQSIKKKTGINDRSEAGASQLKQIKNEFLPKILNDLTKQVYARLYNKQKTKKG